MKEVTKEFLKGVVPERIFWRGEDLFNEGAVQSVDISGNKITAKVLGTQIYTVKVEVKENDYYMSCTCPYEGFCKHRIALGLWMVDNKDKLSKIETVNEAPEPAVDIDALLKKATQNQKEKFLTEALKEYPMLLRRFEVMIAGAENLGNKVDIDKLRNEMIKKMESFDLEDYTRFYDSAPEMYGYREEWEVLRDGAEAEFFDLIESYQNRTLKFLDVGDVISSFKCLIAIYEAVRLADFHDIEDPVCIFEGDGLHYLTDEFLTQLFTEFISKFAAFSIEDKIYILLIDIFFSRLTKDGEHQVYHISDFIELFIHFLKTEKIAEYLENCLRENEYVSEQDSCEILLAVYEKLEKKHKWLDIAEKYYKVNRVAADKLLHHYRDNNNKLVQLAHKIAFQFNNEFIPFFYENLKKEDDSELYKKILDLHARQSQNIKIYKKLKKEYGKDAAWEFIDSLEKNWNTESFYIQLLVEEKAWEKLLSLAQKKSKTEPAMQYLRPIINIYPEEVFGIISKRAEKYLDENVGRSYYHYAADWLRVLKKISDEKVKDRVTFFINHLTDKFNNRPAMKDEFRKAKLI